MTADTEGHVHVAVRRYLRNHDWALVAGQYPGGSDDELPPLNVYDPDVARDNSPDPRRHSQDKLVPDLVAVKGGVLLLVEMKCEYSDEDYAKLGALIGERQADLVSALQKLAEDRGKLEVADPTSLRFVPALGFCACDVFPKDEGYAYFLTRDLDVLELIEPSERLP